MNELTRIEIERDVAEVAAQRAAEQGLTVTAYISLVLRRSFERGPNEDSVLAYDHIDDAGSAQIDREPDEDDESYRRRSALYGQLFGDRN
jgi:hypothetical protein